jgi:hypothetical protein
MYTAICARLEMARRAQRLQGSAQNDVAGGAGPIVRFRIGRRIDVTPPSTTTLPMIVLPRLCHYSARTHFRNETISRGLS